jgi:hypothetical protein
VNCSFFKFMFSVFMFIFCCGTGYAQQKEDDPAVLRRQADVKDVVRAIFRKKSTVDTGEKRRYLTILPSAGYNPSIGLSVGVTSTGAKSYGNPQTTTLSVYNANAYISTYGLASFELKENVFTRDNQFNIQGVIQVGKTIALDYGIGTGGAVQGEGNFSINDFPLANNANIFQIQYTYLKLSERIYKKVSRHLYAGAGIIAHYYTNIDDQRKLGPNIGTHNFRYSQRNDYPSDGYQANGFLLNLQYNSRDQTNRPYKGLYIDLVLRSDQTWLGSNHASLVLRTELRKYISLSKKNPGEILALWLWGSYLLNGTLPYLDLPGAGSDAAGRLGRAYTIGRFKGPSFYYNEAEFRFPLTHSKLLGGVIFANMETANNQNKINLFQYIEPGAGVGLRLLFNKYTRSNLCIDYGVGNYGSSGLFLGLNEVF